MQKTKLGVSVGLLGAAVYFSGLFGEYIPAILIAGYVLLFEENEWLKKACVKAVAVMMSISVVIALLGLIPDCLGWISSLLSIFEVYFSASIVNSIINVITDALSIIRTVLLLVLGVKALNQATINVPVVDNLVNKYMN